MKNCLLVNHKWSARFPSTDWWKAKMKLLFTRKLERNERTVTCLDVRWSCIKESMWDSSFSCLHLQYWKFVEQKKENRENGLFPISQSYILLPLLICGHQEVFYHLCAASRRCWDFIPVQCQDYCKLDPRCRGETYLWRICCFNFNNTQCGHS